MHFLRQYFLFFKRKWQLVLVCFMIIFMNIFSVSTLTTKPALWYDEGINIELARNFSLFGRLDLVVAPNTFSELGAVIGSTGYPVTAPLGLFFSIFGAGFAQARLYMLIWMNAMVVCVFYFVKKQWGAGSAVATTALVVSFPSFYALGRTVMGEIPGFFFLLLSLGFFLEKKHLAWSGVLLGLAVVSKPSVFLFFIPAYAIACFMERPMWRPLLAVATGAILPFVVWVLLYVRGAFSFETWGRLFQHFSNPYMHVGLTSAENIRNNFFSIGQSPTLIYFILLTLLIIVSMFLQRSYVRDRTALVAIVIPYGLLAGWYFLKSIGFLRYLLASQLLVFLLLPAAVGIIAGRFFSAKKARGIAVLFLTALVAVQAVHLFTRAKLFYSRAAIDTVAYIDRVSNGGSVGVINMPVVSSMLPPDRKYHFISTYGLNDVGQDPFLLPEKELPEFLVFDVAYAPSEHADATLRDLYDLATTVEGRIRVYAKRK